MIALYKSFNFLGLEALCEDLQLHQPHSPPWSIGEVACAHAGIHSATAPSDYLRNQFLISEGNFDFLDIENWMFV